jgi:UDP-N-acetylglucosamine--N-acetylmuramyl-(pentapeptide) pyrophosphoryl-undecaprenol N-acetylglucosamine transferase
MNMGEGSSTDFGRLEDAGSKEDKYRRELVRIRKSASFRIGVHLINSLEKPWRILFLPFTLPMLVLDLGLERMGKKHIPKFEQPNFTDSGNRRSIVMFPTNGVGFGHFTRLLAIARRIKKLDPEIEVVFFTTMPTLHLLKREGIPAYHLPGRDKFKDMPAKTWNLIVEENMANVFAIHKPSMFIFDGAFPYRGMLNAIQGRDEIRKVWLRRGMFKKGSTKIPVDSINHFDYVISPKDSVKQEEHDMEFTPTVVKCDPILYLDEMELRPRNDLRNRLGIPHDALVCYLQLGAGQINDIESEISVCLTELEKHENLYVILGESMLGDRLPSIGGRVRVLTDYPNSLDFNAFDFTIMAAGYNSYHEAIRFSVPTISIPNMKTGMDDQLARVEVAEEAGAMIVLREVTPRRVQAAIERLMQESVRKSMINSCETLHRPNGANQMSKWIIDEI